MNLTNHFLIATANMNRSVFANTVIYICRHDNDGAFGLVLNKPSDTSVKELLESLKIPPGGGISAVLHGGPVKPEQVFILHSPPGEYDVTIRVDDNIGVTMSKDILSAIAENRAPQKMQFAFGYAGWDPDQLETEISENAWISIPANSDIIFDLPPLQRLSEATRLLGFDINSLSSETGHA
ncbi:MAG: YqgE/AlgH family protein [Gammaproteobacteria bacterium WSBS_2016_MAG_OTU1]